jgi:ABC-type multidrug transport system ATPase subunit
LRDKTDGAILVRDFKKVYRIRSKKHCKQSYLTAVSNLSFSLEQGECFALLGVNGAGKSTTFKSLTCEVQPTSGSIKIGGYDVQTDLDKARKLIGYCPQPNLIFESLSVQEHL